MAWAPPRDGPGVRAPWLGLGEGGLLGECPPCPRDGAERLALSQALISCRPLASKRQALGARALRHVPLEAACSQVGWGPAGAPTTGQHLQGPPPPLRASLLVENQPSLSQATPRYIPQAPTPWQTSLPTLPTRLYEPPRTDLPTSATAGSCARTASSDLCRQCPSAMDTGQTRPLRQWARIRQQEGRHTDPQGTAGACLGTPPWG